LLLPASLSYFDLLLRAATAGPLLLAAALLIWRYRTTEHLSLAALCFCLVCYLGLTAPAANDFPALRLVTLAGTHFAGIALWFYAVHAFDGQCQTGNWPRWLKASVTGFLLWHASYFLLLGGQGLYHDFSQGLAVALCVHVFWLAVRGFDEELSSGYRLVRVCITLLAAALMLLLAVNEFTRSVPVRQPVVSLTTAGDDTPLPSRLTPRSRSVPRRPAAHHARIVHYEDRAGISHPRIVVLDLFDPHSAGQHAPCQV